MVVLAWGVLILAGVFIALPLLGASFEGFDASYYDCMTTGFAIALIVGVILLVMGAIAWALGVVIHG